MHGGGNLSRPLGDIVTLTVIQRNCTIDYRASPNKTTMRCYNILPLMAGFTFNFAPQAVSLGTRLCTPGRGARNNTPRKKTQTTAPLKKSWSVKIRESLCRRARVLSLNDQYCSTLSN